MPEIRLTTSVAAPPEQVFDLSLDVELHTRSTGAREEIVGGVTEGLMGPGDEVTWRAWHFRIPWTMTSRITDYERPLRFVDEQQRGPFASWWHQHEFHATAAGTEMIDHVRYTSPAGPIGSLVDRLILKSHLTALLTTRNDHIKAEAEAG